MSCIGDSTVSIYNDCDWFRFVYTGGDDDGRTDYLIKKNVTMQYVNANEWWIRENGHTQYFSYTQISITQPTDHTNLRELLAILKNWACLPSGNSTGPGSADRRVRVSKCMSIFNAQFRYDKQELLFCEKKVGSNAMLNHTMDPPVVTLWLGAGGVTGNRVIFQSKQYMPYQPENEICTSIGGVLCDVLEVPNRTARIGYFDDMVDKDPTADIGGSGAFFELGSDGVLYTVVRYFANGVQFDNKIPQSDWNIDQLDGTGGSGITIDITKSQIFIFSLQMNGGCVKFGFNIDGEEIYCHTFKVANMLDTPTMFNYSLPVRGELRQTAPTAVTCKQHWYSVGVCLEGCDTAIPVVPFNFTAHAPIHCPSRALTNPGEHRPLVAIRLKKDLCRGTIWPKRIEVTNETGAMVYWRLILNPTGFRELDSPAPVWNNLGNSSFAQFSWNLNNVGFDNGDGASPDPQDLSNRDALSAIIGEIMDSAEVLLAGRNAAVEAALISLADQSPFLMVNLPVVITNILNAAIAAANSTQTDSINLQLDSTFPAFQNNMQTTVSDAVTTTVSDAIIAANLANGGTAPVLAAGQAQAITSSTKTASMLASDVTNASIAAVNTILSTLNSNINSRATTLAGEIYTAGSSSVSTAIIDTVTAAVNAVVGNPNAITAANNAGLASLTAGDSTDDIATAAFDAAFAEDNSLPPTLINDLMVAVKAARDILAVQNAVSSSIGMYTDGPVAGVPAKNAAIANALAQLTLGGSTFTIVSDAYTGALGVLNGVIAAFTAGLSALTTAFATVSTAIAQQAFNANATAATQAAAVNAGIARVVAGDSALNIVTFAKNALQSSVALIVAAIPTGNAAAVTAVSNQIKTVIQSDVNTRVSDDITLAASNASVPVGTAITDAFASIDADLLTGETPATIVTNAFAAAVAAEPALSPELDFGSSVYLATVAFVEGLRMAVNIDTQIANFINAANAGSFAVADAQAAANLSLDAHNHVTAIVNAAQVAAIAEVNSVYTVFASNAAALLATVKLVRHANALVDVNALITAYIAALSATQAAEATATMAAITAGDASLLAGDDTDTIALLAKNAAYATIVNIVTSLNNGAVPLVNLISASLLANASAGITTALTAAFNAVGVNAAGISDGVAAGIVSLGLGKTSTQIATDANNAASATDISKASALSLTLASTINAVNIARGATVVQNALSVVIGNYTDAALAGTDAKFAARADAAAQLTLGANSTTIANAAKLAAQAVIYAIAATLANPANVTSYKALITQVLTLATADRVQQAVYNAVNAVEPTLSAGAATAALVALNAPNSTTASIITAVHIFLVSNSVTDANITTIVLSLRNTAYNLGNLDIDLDLGVDGPDQNLRSVILASGFMSTNMDKDVSTLFNTFGLHANVEGTVPDVLALTVEHTKGAARCRGSIEWVETK